MADGFWSSEEYDEHAHDQYNQGDLDGALETLKEGLTLYPDAVELYIGLGYARLARDEFAWARVAFDRALLIEPDHEDALVGMGEVLLRLGRDAEALRMFAQVEAMGFEHDIELMLTVGRALYRAEHLHEAREVFARLVTARPEAAEATAALAYVVHRLGDEVGAARHLRRALRLQPELHEARVFLAHILYDRGDGAGALDAFERVPPVEHWDPLALHRILELSSTVRRWDRDDPRLLPWKRRLEVLEAMDDDPVERLLAEIEARVDGQSVLEGFRDRNQLELFQEEDEDALPRIQVILPGGRTLRGTWWSVVRQMREEAGYGHEPLHLFMRILAEGWRDRTGLEIPTTDPEGFLRGAANAGLVDLELVEPTEEGGE
jgi:Flp pilus assembly protein TadD